MNDAGFRCMTPEVITVMEPKCDSTVFSPCILWKNCVIDLITFIHSPKNEKFWMAIGDAP